MDRLGFERRQRHTRPNRTLLRTTTGVLKYKMIDWYHINNKSI